MTANGSAGAGTPRNDTFMSPRGHVVRTTIHGQDLFFTIANPRDVIQKCHVQGRFYEPEELAIIARHFPIGGTFLDIGANVGNHTLYVAKFLHASRIVCIEPNPPAIALLESNVRLNALSGIVDLHYLGVGLASEARDNLAMAFNPRNLGSGQFIEGDGTIRLVRADALLSGQRFDFVKIDVEGMELEVLSGMEGLLAQCRPVMFVEVDNSNAAAFQDWLTKVGYDVLQTFRRYRVNANFLVAPKP